MKENTLYLETPSFGPYICTDICQGQLPRFLEEAVTITDQPEQQDILLLSALTACSYALPHIKMLHGQPQHTYYPNLMTLIIAPPASGKGVMNNARLLVEPIHKQLRTKKMFARIPGNSSSAAFLDIYDACNGNGIVIETEMDTLTKIWKKDFGDYSDLFRQAFEHEPYMKARRVGMRQTKSLVFNHPQLSVLLSGTPNQVRPLLGTGEDGLASRFMPYVLSDVRPFDYRVMLHGDHYEENGAQAVYERLGQEMLARYEWLKKQDHDCLWSIEDGDAELLGKHLADLEDLAILELKKSPDGRGEAKVESFRPLFNRMVVTLKRIGMIISALRLPVPTDEANTLPEKIYCSEEDLKLLFLFAEKLLWHVMTLVDMLPEQQLPLAVNVLGRPAEKRAQDLLAQLPEKFSYADWKAVCEQNDVPKTTMKRRMDLLLKSKQVVRYARGQYKKV